MSKARTIVLFISAAFLIIGIHQTITLGFEVSYWIIMLSLSLYFLSRLMKQNVDGNKEKKTSTRKSRRPMGNRQSKRYMNRSR